MTSLTILRTGLSQLKQSLEEARREATSVQDYEQAVDQDLEDAISLFPHSAPFSGSLQIESGTRWANFVELDLSLALATLANDIFGCRRGPARGDRDLLTQLFVNLIENALRHTPDGATVGMSLRKNEHRLIADVRRFYWLEGSRSTSGSGLVL